MQKAQDEPSLLRASRDAFSDKHNRSQRGQQITEGLVISTLPTRSGAEVETIHQSMCKEAMNDHAGSGSKPANTSDRHQKPEYQEQP